MSRRYIGRLIDAFNTLKVANAPTIGTATGGNAQACVTFTAPACVGGGAVTSYTAVSCPGFKTGTGTTSPITVACLTNCTAYTFRVNATNVFGPSAFSAASSSVTPVNDGTLGIFALGWSPSYSTTRNKYTYATCVSTSATAATQASGFGAAVGNSIKGIFALGLISGNNTASRDKYTYSGDTVSSAASASTANNSGAAAGNSTVGIFALAANCYVGCSYTTSVRNKYTYSSCSNAVTTSSSIRSRGTSATGNSTVGIFSIGTTSPCGCTCFNAPTTTRNKYTYSNDANATATASGTATSCGSAVGTNTVGIFTQCGSARQKYTYSGCTVSSATSASASNSQGSAVGNGSRGIFSLGNAGTTRNKYTYSGDVNAVVGTCGSQSAAARGGSGAGNGTAGVNI